MGFKKTLQNIPISVKASLGFTVCNVMQKGSAIISVPIFTRIMTTEQYGVTVLYQSWYTVLTIIVTLNLFSGVFNNGMNKFQSSRREYVSSMQGLVTVIAIAWLVIFLSVPEIFINILGLPFHLILFMLLSFTITSAFDFWSSLQRYEYKYKQLLIATCIYMFLSVVVSVICVYSSPHKASAKIYSSGLVLLVTGAVFYFINWKDGKKLFNKIFWKYAFMFNIILIPYYLSTMILNQSDKIMIAKFCTVKETAIYSVGYQVAHLLSLLTGAINTAMIPYIYKKLNEKKYADLQHSSINVLLIISALVLMLVFISPELTLVLASTQYSEAAWLVPPLTLAVFFNYVYTLFGNIQFYFEKNKVISIASIIGAVVNVLLNYLLLPFFGYTICAYTTLFCYILFCVCHYFFMRKTCKSEKITEKIYHINKICGICLGVSLLAFIIMTLYNQVIIRYSCLFICLIYLYLKKDSIKRKILN